MFVLGTFLTSNYIFLQQFRFAVAGTVPKDKIARFVDLDAGRYCCSPLGAKLSKI